MTRIADGSPQHERGGSAVLVEAHRQLARKLADRFTVHLYKASYDAKTKAYGKPAMETADAAYTLLKSEALKTQLQAMRTAGTTLMIFPDNNNHLHVDQR